MNKDYEKAVKYINDNELDFGLSFVAIRFDYNDYKVGDVLPESEDMTDDAEKGAMLEGTSCVSPNAQSNMVEDYGGNIYIVTGDRYDAGNDYGEMVVTNAKVIAIVD